MERQNIPDSPMTPMETSQSDWNQGQIPFITRQLSVISSREPAKVALIANKEPKLLASSNLQIDQSARCQYPDCHATCRNHRSRCFNHMVIHGSPRFHCSKCNYKANRTSSVAQHFKGNCQGKIVDKLDQGMIEEWRELSVICYPDRAKEIGALIAKKESKLLARSNLQIDRSAKCQHPNCRSGAQLNTLIKRLKHLIAHGPRRFTCSNCDITGHQLNNIKTHFLRKTGCQGKIIDQIDQTMIDEWTKLARICFPLHVSGLTKLFAKQLAKSQNLPGTTRTRAHFMQQRTIEIADLDIQNDGERNGLPQIEETEEAPLTPTPSRSPSMAIDLWQLELSHPTTSGDALIQADDIPSSSSPLLNSVVKEESPQRTQPIQQQDIDSQLQELTRKFASLRAENERLNARVAEEKKSKDVAHKLLGEKNTENEMQKQKIRELQAELEKQIVILD